jgi:hypothetical protein
MESALHFSTKRGDLILDPQFLLLDLAHFSLLQRSQMAMPTELSQTIVERPMLSLDAGHLERRRPTHLAQRHDLFHHVRTSRSRHPAA